MGNKLAIVLPAYKPEFLRETLQSMANQSDKRFKLYIGDDHSPFNLRGIISEFEGTINLVYHRFENNLGSEDLVGHWKRCVELTEGEEWIWLFADDDLMDNHCVQAFYQYIEKDANCDIVHFNTLIIDQTGRLLKTPERFPEKMDVGDFFYKRINYQISSFVVEYIFRKSIYDQEGGFINFDLAWCSDDASWMNFGHLKSIKTIPDASVQWRNSGLNITTLNKDKDMLCRKVHAQTAFINWAIKFFRENRIADKTTAYQKARWVLDLPFHSGVFGLKEKREISKEVLRAMETKPSVARVWLHLGYCEIKCRLKKWIRL